MNAPTLKPSLVSKTGSRQVRTQTIEGSGMRLVRLLSNGAHYRRMEVSFHDVLVMIW